MHLFVPPLPIPASSKPGQYVDCTMPHTEQLLDLICDQDRLALPNQAILSLFDIRMERFLYMGDKVRTLGYEPEQYTCDAGLALWRKNIHPRHQKAVLVFSSIGYNQCMAAIRKGYYGTSFCMHYQYQTTGGDYSCLLQTNTLLSTVENERPTFLLTHSYDISHLMKKEGLRLLVKTPGRMDIWGYNASKNQAEPQAPITTKEQGILHLLSRRKSTKEIALALHISPHTVDTHRRNLLRKSGCADTTALITYCKMVGII